MAEEQSSQQERTEQPTQKRLRDARRRGQIARSRELTMTVVMVAAAIAMYASGEWFVGSIAELMRNGLSIDPAKLLDADAPIVSLAESIEAGLRVLLPLFIVLPIAAIFGGSAIGGFAFSTQAMQPKMSKLNPLSGMKRMFGTHGLMELVKAIAKAGVVGTCAVIVLKVLSPKIIALGTSTIESALPQTGKMMVTTLLVCTASLGFIALVDVPFQIWSNNKKLRMTRKEIYDEMKETEGRPEVKSRIRQLQQELANKRMLEEVPTADVVVTNPTHYAVALRYADAEMRAPVVVAKGVDYMAAQIREVAKKSGVPLFEAPALARSLHATTELNQEIDPRLYTAVAQVLTYIYQLRNAETNRGNWPTMPTISLEKEIGRDVPDAATEAEES